MSQEDQVRKLIRLKRHETPREGYFEDFLAEFQSRREQEKEVPAKPSFSLLSFFSGFWQGKSRPRVLVFGLAYAALVFAIVWWPKGPDNGIDENRRPVIYQPGLEEDQKENDRKPSPPVRDF